MDPFFKVQFNKYIKSEKKTNANKYYIMGAGVRPHNKSNRQALKKRAVRKIICKTNDNNDNDNNDNNDNNNNNDNNVKCSDLENISTDCIREGNNNLYYTADRVKEIIKSELANSHDIVANSVSVTSDIKLKENIKSIDTTKLSQLNPVAYNYINDKENTLHYGLLAQEVEKIYPELVYHNSDNIKSINYINIIALLIKEIQILKLNKK